jgi:riboflavin kinase/FMN adenylyltransferase
MIVFKSFEEIATFSDNAVISIGNFDGIHCGHKELMQRINKKKLEINGKSLVVTFSNHPAMVLRPGRTPDLLASPEHKLVLLERHGIDGVLFLPFTKELSKLTARAFVEKLRQHLPFKELVLGYDAAFGKDREGNKETVIALAKEYGFKVDYAEKIVIDDYTLSSTLIRQCVREGKLELAEKLLGRPYAIFGTVAKGPGKGKQLGFPTINIPTKGLCLPPFGIYCTRIHLEGEELLGVGNLGSAPTVHNDREAMLEVHIFDFNKDIYGKQVEVILEEYLRPEERYASVELLIEQIQKDVAKAKKCFSLSQ